MKHISRNKVEKIIEYLYFKNLSSRETGKLLKMSKTTVLDYYHKFLSLNLKYADLILLPDKIFNEAPPSRLATTTSCTCRDLELVKALVSSGITAAAKVPQLIILASFHHRPSPIVSPINDQLAKYVTAIEINEVIHTNEVKGFSKLNSFARPYFDLL